LSHLNYIINMNKVNFRLITAIRKGFWLIDQSWVSGNIQLLTSILSGTAEVESTEPTHPSIISFFDDDEMVITEQRESFLTVEGEDSISLIPIIGPVMKHDSWCESGTKTRAKQLLEADANNNIQGHIILLDTPGGETQACELMSEAIKQCTKPVYAVVDGLCASAGMWIAAGCARVYASSKTDIIGCIGTVSTLVDYSGALEKAGIKIHEVYSTLSPEKNKESRDALAGDYTTLLKNIIDPLTEVFHSHLKSSRPNINVEALKGATYVADKAIEMGLVDELGGINSAINHMFEFNKLRSYKGKQLSAAERSTVESILNKAGIQVKIQQPASVLLEPSEGEKKIYVYAEDGEELVGKRCVYAAEDGEPTDEPVEDGEHSLSDGSVVVTAIKEDGYSYVNEVKEGEAAVETEGGAELEKEKLAADAIAALVNEVAAMRAELATAKKSTAFGKQPRHAANGGGAEPNTYRPGSKFAARKKEILEKSKRK
jgi:ClpP class serine protease